jgi:hypothetical protein
MACEGSQFHTASQSFAATKSLFHVLQLLISSTTSFWPSAMIFLWCTQA